MTFLDICPMKILFSLPYDNSVAQDDPIPASRNNGGPPIFFNSPRHPTPFTNLVRPLRVIGWQLKEEKTALSPIAVPPVPTGESLLMSKKTLITLFSNPLSASFLLLSQFFFNFFTSHYLSHPQAPDRVGRGVSCSPPRFGRNRVPSPLSFWRLLRNVKDPFLKQAHRVRCKGFSSLFFPPPPPVFFFVF